MNIRLYLLAKRMMTDEVLVIRVELLHEFFFTSIVFTTITVYLIPIRAILWHVKLKVVCEQVFTFSTQTKFRSSQTICSRASDKRIYLTPQFDPALT